MLLRARKRTRRRGRADVRRPHHLSAADRGVDRPVATRISQLPDARSAGVPHRRRALSLAAVSHRSRSRDHSASNPIRACSPRRLRAERGAAHRAAIVRAAGMSAAAGRRPPPPVAAAPGIAGRRINCRRNFKTLIDRYRNEGGGRTVSGRAAGRRDVPDRWGRRCSWLSELTAESTAPSIDLSIRRIK